MAHKAKEKPLPGSREYLRRIHQDFWENPIFKYKWSAKQWYDYYAGDDKEVMNIWVDVMDHQTRSTFANSLDYLLKTAPTVLWAEGRINYEEYHSLNRMMKSPDQENWYIAISIMKQKAGGKM